MVRRSCSFSWLAVGVLLVLIFSFTFPVFPQASTADAGSPAVVTALDAAGLSSASVDLNWLAPGDDGTAGSAPADKAESLPPVPSDATPVQVPGHTTRISVASDGRQGDGASVRATISADGRFVAFESDATNLAPGDTNDARDVFVHNRQTSQTSRVSVASDGTQGNSGSIQPAISADGRFVAFESWATNLAPGDTNEDCDVFVHDRQTGQTSRVSLASDGTQGNRTSWDAAISADGRFVAFESWATTLVPGDTNYSRDVFVHDRQTGQTSRVSVASDGAQGNAGSVDTAISANGRFVAFESWTTNLVPEDTNDKQDIFVHDRQTGQTSRVSLASDGTQGKGTSWYAAISADGRFVAFGSWATNLVPGDTNDRFDIFVHDRQTGQTSRVSVASDGTQGNGITGAAAISADGRFVTFYSSSSSLVSGDTNDKEDVFVHDRQTGQTSRVSLASDGTQGNGDSGHPAISADGRSVAFDSVASNLVPGDTSDELDVFVNAQGKGGSTSWLWIIEEVDTTTSCFGMNVGLAVGSDGVPHISYYDSDEEVLMHARRTASGWERTVADSSERVGRSSSIALDSLDHPHIGYRDLKNNTLKYAHWDGAQWDVQFLGTNEYGWDPSVVVDSEDRPHISYLGYHPVVGGGQTPKYTHWDGSKWEIDVIEPVFTSSGTSLALDSRERPHVSYGDDGALKHAVYRGGRWRIEIVDSKALSGHWVGLYSSLAIDDVDNPHISYALNSQEYTSSPWPEGLRYACSQDGTWEYDAPDSRGLLGFYNSLALDAANQPHISYHDSDRQALKHVHWDGAVWTVSVVDSPVGIGGATSLDLDQDGNAHIAYCDGIGGAIKYARGVVLENRAFLPWMAR